MEKDWRGGREGEKVGGHKKRGGEETEDNKGKKGEGEGNRLSFQRDEASSLKVLLQSRKVGQ